MPIKKGRKRTKPKRGGKYTTMPVKGLKPVKGKPVKPKTKRPKKGIPIKGRFTIKKQFV